MLRRTMPSGRDTSPSSRRAWIEIGHGYLLCERIWVALLAEGVDRNSLVVKLPPIRAGRPPRGGRG